MASISILQKALSLLLMLASAALSFPLLVHAKETGIALAPYASGFSSPVFITHASDGSQRLFVVEQIGVIRIVRNGVPNAAPFLDISDRVLFGGEQGLLSMAFPPGYAEKGYFYVNYTRRPDGATVISRFRTTADPDTADPSVEEVIITVEQPFANHNGGQIAFGPADGFLYIGMGDGGSGGDPQNFAQNLSDLPGNKRLLGKLLRIDVESGLQPYAIPQTNPVLEGRRTEVWALGLRNPWRFSFDRGTGDLYIGDVGQGLREEIDFRPASSAGGENYGWNILEGSLCFFPASGCSPPSNYTPPVTEYDHGLGCSVTGGSVYRGVEFPPLNGLYFFGDFCSGRLWSLRRVANTWQQVLLLDTGMNISTFGEDEGGGLYVADYATGGISRIVPSITLIAPNGGEVIPSGSVFPVSWTAPAEATSFRVKYSLDKGITWRVADGVFSGNSFAWNVPMPKKNRRGSRIKVIGFDAQDNRIGGDISDAAFTVESVSITSPVHADILMQGTSHVITWRTNGTREPVDSFRLFYTKNRGRTWTRIVRTEPGTGNPGRFSWDEASENPIPNVRAAKSGSRLKIVLKDAQGRTTGIALSDFFTIGP